MCLRVSVRQTDTHGAGRCKYRYICILYMRRDERARERKRKANEQNGGRKRFTQTAKTLSRFVALALIIYREISFQSKRVGSY